MNQANIRDVRSVVTTNILANWSKGDSSTPTLQMSTGADTGWYGLAKVSKNGNIDIIGIYVAPTKPAEVPDSIDKLSFISVDELTTPKGSAATETKGKIASLDDSSDFLRTITFDNSGVYYIQVYVNDIDYTASTFTH